ESFDAAALAVEPGDEDDRFVCPSRSATTGQSGLGPSSALWPGGGSRYGEQLSAFRQSAWPVLSDQAVTEYGPEAPPSSATSSGVPSPSTSTHWGDRARRSPRSRTWSSCPFRSRTINVEPAT